MKKVAHRVHENRPALLPAQRDLQRVRVKSNFESVAVVRSSNRLQSQRQSVGVTVLATGTDFGTSGHCRNKSIDVS